MISDDDLYWYKANYEKNHDGDTVTVQIDLGFNTWFRTDVRMYGINTPELTGATKVSGQASQKFLEVLLKACNGTGCLRLKSYKDQSDKYGGRVLGELWLPIKFTTPADPKTAYFDKKGTFTNLNQLLIQAGLAKPYFGTGEKL